MKLAAYLILCLMLGTAQTHAHDTIPMRRGEQLFMDYCSGCHTLRYMSHPRVSMPVVEARHWFGTMPPDLSLTARERGTDWLTAYLTGFYPDSHRPFGSNNRMIPDVLMPDVLAPLQEHRIENQLSESHSQTYQQVVQDIVFFLAYVAEPTKSMRYRIGFGVVGFLCVFLIVCIRFLCHKKNKL